VTSAIAAFLRRSVRGRVASAAATVTLFSFLAKLAGAAKEVAVARQFGTSDEVDAFVLAFLLPSFAISVIGGSLNTAFVPVYVDVRKREGPEAAQRLLSTTMTLSVLLLIGAAVVLVALVPTLVPLVSSKFTPSKLRLTGELSYLLIPCLVLAGATTLWSAVLNAHERFAAPAAASLALPAVTIATLLALRWTWGIHALAAGTLLGFCAEAAMVGAALRREGLSMLPRWGGVTPDALRVVRQYAPMAAGMLVMAANPVVNSVMAARLGPGSVASLGYGYKLVGFAMGLGTGAIGTAVLPHFSGLVATKQWETLRGTVNRYAAIVLVASVPLTIGAALLSEPVVRLLFERGAFTRTDTELVARIQALYMLGVPFVVTGMLFVRVISALALNQALMWVSIVAAVVNVAGNYLLAIPFGVAGIALSTTVVYAFTFTVTLLYSRRKLRLLSGSRAEARSDR